MASVGRAAPGGKPSCLGGANQLHPARGKPPLGKFFFRVDRFCHGATAQIPRGQRVLHRQPFRQLTPNRSFGLASDWLPQVDPQGEALRLILA